MHLVPYGSYKVFVLRLFNDDAYFLTEELEGLEIAQGACSMFLCRPL